MPRIPQQTSHYLNSLLITSKTPQYYMRHDPSRDVRMLRSPTLILGLLNLRWHFMEAFYVMTRWPLANITEVYAYRGMYTHTDTDVYACIYMNLHEYTCIYLNTHVCTCIYTHIYIYIYHRCWSLLSSFLQSLCMYMYMLYKFTI